MRVRFTAAEHASVKAAARARLVSFNTFVAQIAVMAAKRVLEVPLPNPYQKIADDALNGATGISWLDPAE